MINITYFHRNPSSGYSIGKVSQIYIAEIEKKEHIENFYMPFAKADIHSILKNIRFAFVHRNRKGINHITGDLHYLALVLPSKRTIITVHDVGWNLTYKRMNPLKAFVIKCLQIYPLYRCSRVVCVSEYTKSELLNVMPSLSSKVCVIPNAVGTEFKYVHKEFNQNKPVILHVGHAASAERKNLFRTIEALQGLNIHLRIIGHLNEQVIVCLNKYQIDYSNIYDLSDEEIAEEYQKCDIVNFPSLFEGFGMPIIEGQATGRIVVTSNLSPMKDIAGDNAALVDPYDVKSIRECYLKIIQDSFFREILIKNGYKNILRFKVASVAKQYYELYQNLK